MASLTEKDISNLSYRMTTQIDLAMNDLKNVKENIKHINSIINKKDFERKIEETSEEKKSSENSIITSYEHKIEEPETPRAGMIGHQRNMSHNRWVSSLRNPFSHYFL